FRALRVRGRGWAVLRGVGGRARPQRRPRRRGLLGAARQPALGRGLPVTGGPPPERRGAQRRAGEPGAQGRRGGVGAAGATMHDRPTALELIAAARGHLEREVLPALGDARLRFRTLVAAHVLGVVERELARGEAPLREEWTRLQALLGRADAPPASLAELTAALQRGEEELCARIRAGDADAGPFRE